jgi:hypothetical protein
MAVVCPKLHVNDKDVTYRLIHCTNRERMGKVEGRKGRNGIREEDMKEIIGFKVYFHKY